jgi:hypothetical protein
VAGVSLSVMPTPPTIQHPFFEVRFEKAPSSALAFAEGNTGEVAFACPTGEGAAIDSTEIVGGLFRSEESTHTYWMFFEAI